MIDPEKVSNVQKASNKRDQEGRAEKLCWKIMLKIMLKNYAYMTIYTIASYAKLD